MDANWGDGNNKVIPVIHSGINNNNNIVENEFINVISLLKTGDITPRSIHINPILLEP